ncbi:alpha-hydroxy acid oxidase [Microbaculum sp. FT89]|uniref:alpha-hydroxy acid oxidase n=1 Tax=Microbaculum sp. FT89 TaxID=3447298 RepID=UPI003F53C94F
MARTFASRRVDRALSIDELRHMARRRLPEVVFEYLDGGAEDEVTLRRNRAVFDDVAFLPAALNDVATVDATTSLFGRSMAFPFAVAPTGFNGLMRRDGDLALARAAAAADIPFAQSTVSNARIETVAAVPGLRHWMQLYVFRDQAFMEALLERAERAGCEALILTVDSNVFGNREWDKRNYATPSRPRLSRRFEALRHPGWVRDVLLPGIPGFGNLDEILPPDRRDLSGAAHWSRTQIDPSLSWRHLDWLRTRWRGPLVVKGLLSPSDAVRARDAGADGIVLSNHGGRQLDGAVAPLQILAETRQALGSGTVLMIDGGIRRGSDIAKAVALGADAVLSGRAPLYGLAAGGHAGVARALALLAEQFTRVMALLGRPTVAALTTDCLRDVADLGPLRAVEAPCEAQSIRDRPR